MLHNKHRLESLWRDQFGKQYTDRNDIQDKRAGVYHYELYKSLSVSRILEVGCNIGFNLGRMIKDPHFQVWGIDLNLYALEKAHQRLPKGHWSQASAVNLPFPDCYFEMVFTCGVLIHIAPDLLERVFKEIHRTTRRYIWLGEYYSSEMVEVPYRGQKGALHKCDFGGRFLENFSNVKLIEKGFLGEDAGFDNVTWWLIEKDLA